MTTLSRRGFLFSATASVVLAGTPLVAARTPGRDPRLVILVLRGGMDGLIAAPPLFDPAYASLRPDMAEAAGKLHDLGSGFALHPALTTLHGLFGSGEAALVHAVATPYRARSHFDGQDVLETGGTQAGRIETGWLNRAAIALYGAESAADRNRPRALAFGSATPRILAGAAHAASIGTNTVRDAGAAMLDAALALYGATDALMFDALTAARGLEANAPDMTPDGGRIGAARTAARTLAGLLAREEGPRLGVIDVDGWDTHIRDGGAEGRLARLLEGLDQIVLTLKQGLGAAWTQTAVLAVTEFGRTVERNGSFGTDHGTGTCAFLAGGAVRGGRVIADWPGLSPAQRFEGRDLNPTRDLRSLCKGVLAGLWDLPPRALHEEIFPGSADIAALDGLIV